MIAFLRWITFKRVVVVAALGAAGWFGGREIHRAWLRFQADTWAIDVRSNNAGVARRGEEGLLGMDPRYAVTALIDALPEQEMTTAITADYAPVYDLLSEITGEPYVEDPAWWRAWRAGERGRAFLGEHTE